MDERCTPYNNGAAVMAAGRTPSQRRMLFFSTCVPLRLGLSAAVFAAGVFFPRATAVTGIVAGCIIAVYNFVLQERSGCRWWFPGGTAALGVAAAIIGALVLVGRAPATLLGGVMLAQVTGGVAGALATRPWNI